MVKRAFDFFMLLIMRYEVVSQSETLADPIQKQQLSMDFFVIGSQLVLLKSLLRPFCLHAGFLWSFPSDLLISEMIVFGCSVDYHFFWFSLIKRGLIETKEACTPHSIDSSCWCPIEFGRNRTVFNTSLKRLYLIEHCLIVCGFVCLIECYLIEHILFAALQFCTIVEMLKSAGWRSYTWWLLGWIERLK